MKKIFILILMFLFFPIVIYAQSIGGCYGHDMMYPYLYGGWGVILMPFIWLAVIGLAVYFIYRIALGQGGPHQGYREEKAINILKERYAKGEISKEQFEEMKKNIKI